MSDTVRILIVLLLVLGNAIFVAAEYALVTARRSRLEERAKGGSRGARTALSLLDEPTRFIGTIQLGITAFAILIGAVAEPLLSGFLDPPVSTTVSFIIGFAILTYVSVVVGELVPKAISLQKAEGIAAALAVPLNWLQRIARPLVWVLQVSADSLARLFGIQKAPAGVVMYSEEDIRHAVATAEDEGVIEEVEEEMLYKVFDFSHKEVHDVMVPRPEVIALSIDLPTQECLAALIDSPYTRYPVYREEVDNVVGILHVRDLFSALYDAGIDNVQVEDLVRPSYVVPETKDLGAMLAEFRRTNQHMAIVIDEYGRFEGIVTLEDVVEEIVGEIEDEYDLPDESIEQLDENWIRVDGTYPIDDFNERFAQELPQADYNTIAGFVFGEIGRAAEAGDEVVWNGLRFRVREVDGPRIESLDIEFLATDDSASEEIPTSE